jgi:hypothetical protein
MSPAGEIAECDEQLLRHRWFETFTERDARDDEETSGSAVDIMRNDGPAVFVRSVRSLRSRIFLALSIVLSLRKRRHSPVKTRRPIVLRFPLCRRCPLRRIVSHGPSHSGNLPAVFLSRPNLNDESSNNDDFDGRL